jgi:hypothetical protein
MPIPSVFFDMMIEPTEQNFFIAQLIHNIIWLVLFLEYNNLGELLKRNSILQMNLS